MWFEGGRSTFRRQEEAGRLISYKEVDNRWVSLTSATVAVICVR